MDVGLLTAVMPQGTSATGAAKPASTGGTGFGMMLGSIMGSIAETAGANVPQAAMVLPEDGLMALIGALLNPDTEELTLLPEEQLNLEKIDALIEEKFPDLPDWLGQLLNMLTPIAESGQNGTGGEQETAPSLKLPISVEQLTRLKEALSGKQYVQAISETLQLLAKMEPVQLQNLPSDKVAELIKASKMLEKLPQTANLVPQAMNELEKVAGGLKHLTGKMEEWSKESRFQSIFAEVANGETKPKAMAVPPLPAMNLILKKPGTETHAATAVEDVKAGDIVQTAQHQMTRTEQFSLHVNEKQPAEAKMNEFIKEFNSILARSSLTQGAGGTKLLIKLYPEHLGQLRVELLQKDGMMMARLVASSNTAKDMLDSQLHSLRQAFTQQNIQVDKVEVIYPQGDAQKYTNQDGKNGQQGQGGQQQGAAKQELPEDKEHDFHETLNSMLFQSEA